MCHILTSFTSDTCSSIICFFVTVQGLQPLVSICVFSSAGIILIFSPSIYLLFLCTKYVAAWKIFLPYFMYCIYLHSMQVFSWKSRFVRGVEPIILLLPNTGFWLWFAVFWQPPLTPSSTSVQQNVLSGYLLMTELVLKSFYVLLSVTCEDY